MHKQKEDILVVADAKDWRYTPARSVVADLGIEWDAVDIREDPRGGVQLYGARSVPEAFLSAKEGLRGIWKQRPPAAPLRKRNAEIFRSHLAGTSFQKAGRPFGLALASARVAFRHVCQRAKRYSDGIPLGWYRDIGEMAERLCLSAEEADIALRLAEIYYSGLPRDPDAPSDMLQAKRIMESYRT